MSLLPQNAQKVEVTGATVDFFKYEENGAMMYQFDSSRSGHPEPMINAMSGLQILDDNSKLVMINSKAPAGLFPKIENDFDFEVEDLTDGRVKVVFAKKTDANSTTNFNDTGCAGGACSN